MKSIEMTGKTVEDAIAAGLKALGCESSDAEIAVLDMGSPGLFGMFGRLAKVRLTLKEDDSFDFEMPEMTLSQPKTPKAKQEPKAAPQPKPQPQVKAQPKAEAAPAAAPAPAPVESAAPVQAPEAVTPVEEEEEFSPAPAPAEEPVRRERRRGGRRSASVEEAPAAPLAVPPTDRPDFEEMPVLDAQALEGAAKAAYEFLSRVTSDMGAEVEMRIQEKEGTLYVSMMGDTLGILIGRRGDTLDALQYLTGLVVNKGRDEYLRVSLDTEHYRARREEALTKLAGRMAARARRTGRKVTLEPMNPYERRVLHSALQADPYVTTHSEGEEPYRRVIITLK